MSPEQARGRVADKRSDVWAFGCVLYEMLTSSRAFHGEDVSDTLAAVLRGEPDWTALPVGTPAPIRKLLRRCLEKDRKRRLADAADARLEIEEALAAPSVDGTAAEHGLAPRSARSRVLTWTLAGSTLGFATALVLLWAPGEAAGSSADAAGCRFGRGCVVASPLPRERREQCRHFPGWHTALARPRGCLFAGWTSRKPPSSQARRAHTRRSSRQTGSGSDLCPVGR